MIRKVTDINKHSKYKWSKHSKQKTKAAIANSKIRPICIYKKSI